MPKIPSSVAASNEYRQELLNKDATAAYDMATRWIGVEDSIRPKLEALITEIEAARAAGKEVNRITLLQADRYQALLAQMALELNRFNNYSVGIIGDLQNGAVSFAQQTAANLILATAGDVGAVGLTFSRLSTEAAENIAALSRAGQPLANILANNYPATANLITDKLITGVAVGINPREVARDIIKNQLSQAYNHTILVARDQHMRAYRTATAQAFQTSGVVTQYRRLAAKNDRTCLACLALDGQVYELNEPMPTHPQDRCTMLPIIGGFGPALFSPVKFQTGEEWFNKQPEEYKRQALGPGRYQLYREGGFSFKQLATVKENDTWGPGAAVTSLAELKRGGGGYGRGGQGRLPLPPKPPKPTGPAPMLAQVPKFRDRAQAEKWVRENYANITPDFRKMELTAIQDTTEAINEMATKYPYVARQMVYLGTYTDTNLRPSVRARKRWGGEIAHAYPKLGIMGLNPKSFGDVARMIKNGEISRASHWTFEGPAGAGLEIKAVIYHEYGHLLEGFFIRTPPPAGAPWGRPDQVLRDWASAARLRDEGLTRYGKTNHAETIAEAFNALHLYPPEEQPRSSRELARLTELLYSTYVKDYDPPPFDKEEDYLAWGEAQDEERAALIEEVESLIRGDWTPKG
jgi:SPP1 gp7 family putative phage head morphogenesis protein